MAAASGATSYNPKTAKMVTIKPGYYHLINMGWTAGSNEMNEVLVSTSDDTKVTMNKDGVQTTWKARYGQAYSGTKEKQYVKFWAATSSPFHGDRTAMLETS
jgi:hypothetical protein